MKTFKDQTYYEILRIPEDADVHEVKCAYHEALELYEEDSLATYALFSEEQRAGLLQAIETAYFILSDENRRNTYDQQLIESGQWTAASTPEKRAVETSPDPAVARPRKLRELQSWVKTRSKEGEIACLVDEIQAKVLISGIDLKQLRTKLGITHSEVYEITRISRSVLTMIEENQFDDLPAEVFLKSFLKSYAEILQLDSYCVVEGYLKSMAQDDKLLK